MSRKLLALAVTAVALGLLPTASADAPEAHGWWSRTRVAGLPVQPPSTVPEGGLYVAGDPTGPSGVSAIRLTLPPDSFVGDVVLVIDSAQGTPSIQACVARLVWSAEDGGPLEFAPESDCADGLAFAAVTETEVRIPAGGLVRDGMLNIVLEPTDGALFQASFQPPNADTIDVQRTGGGGDLGSDDFSAFEAFEPGEFFSLPVMDTPFNPTAPALAAPAPAPDTAPATGPSRPVPSAVRPSRAPVDNRTQFIAAALLLNLVLAYLWVLTRGAHTPRLLGPMAKYSSAGAAAAAAAEQVELRGIGRFVRPRTGPPPKL